MQAFIVKIAPEAFQARASGPDALLSLNLRSSHSGLQLQLTVPAHFTARELLDILSKADEEGVLLPATRAAASPELLRLNTGQSLQPDQALMAHGLSSQDLLEIRWPLTGTADARDPLAELRSPPAESSAESSAYASTQVISRQLEPTWAWLIVVRSPDTSLRGAIFPLQPKTTIGRQDGDIVLSSDPTASSRHAYIHLETPASDDQAPVYIIDDLGSTNGVFVGVPKIGTDRLSQRRDSVRREELTLEFGNRVQQRELRDGDFVCIGHTIFAFKQVIVPANILDDAT